MGLFRLERKGGLLGNWLRDFRLMLEFLFGTDVLGWWGGLLGITRSAGFRLMLDFIVWDWRVEIMGRFSWNRLLRWIPLDDGFLLSRTGMLRLWGMETLINGMQAGFGVVLSEVP